MADWSEEWTQMAGPNENVRSVILRREAPIGMHGRFVRHILYKSDRETEMILGLGV